MPTSKVHTIIRILSLSGLLALFGCAREVVPPARIPQASDSLYTAKAAMRIYGTQPERALTIIDSGRDNDDRGKLELGDNVMVRYKIGNNWSEPVPVAYEYGRKAAWYHTETRIESCTHPGYNANNCPYHKHP